MSGDEIIGTTIKTLAREGNADRVDHVWWNFIVHKFNIATFYTYLAVFRH